MPELPEDLESLKRPALLKLAKRFGVKAVGKNADLILKLQHHCNEEQHVDQQDDKEADTLERTADDAEEGATADQEGMDVVEEEDEGDVEVTTEEEQSSVPGSQQVAVGASAPMQPAIDDISIPGAYFATPPRALIKRARSPSPAGEPQASSSQQQQQQSIPQSPLPFATPRIRRSIAPLPRKSMAVSSSPSRGLYPSLPPPTPQFRPKEANIFLSPVKGGHLSPRKATMPAFTFSCPAPPTIAQQASAANAQAGSSTGPGTAAKTLLLDRLNERLAATGSTPVSSFEPTIKASQSSPSRLWGSSSRHETQTEKRFKQLHQKEMARGGSIANHWSMGRRGPGKEAESSQATEVPHKRAKLSPSTATMTATSVPQPRTDAPQRPPAPRPPPVTQPRPLPSAVAAAVAAAAGPKCKARSSLHAATKMGRRKSQLAGAVAGGPRGALAIRRTAPAVPPVNASSTSGPSASTNAPTVRRFFTSGPAAAAVAAAAAAKAQKQKVLPAAPKRVTSATLQPAPTKVNTLATPFRAGEASRPKAKLPSSSSLSSIAKRADVAAPTTTSSRPAVQHAKLSQQQAARRVLDARRRAADESRLRAREERLAREKGALVATSAAAKHTALTSLPSAPQHSLCSPSRSISSTAAAMRA